VQVVDWEAIYNADGIPEEALRLESLLPVCDLTTEIEYDGWHVTVYGRERLHLAEVKQAPSVHEAVRAMPDFVRQGLKSFLFNES
jgi:hypothetical protein